MNLYPPKKTTWAPYSFDTNVLSSGHCGLHRASLDEAPRLMPTMAKVLESAPITDPQNWEVDIKVHMLMPNQYPCVPNWHCDFVPRVDGDLRFDLTKDEQQGMYLWVSGTPLTEFITNKAVIPGYPKQHNELGEYISEHQCSIIDPQFWYQMGQHTPHRGTVSTKHQWRVFIRIVDKALVEPLKTGSVIRRHCQVYLDPNSFTW